MPKKSIVMYRARGSAFYLTANTGRFLVGSKESISTPQAGPGRMRGAADRAEADEGRARFKQTVTHFVVFESPELHSRATF
eukprot:5298849-Pyramimonas_sp.AAC.1